MSDVLQPEASALAVPPLYTFNASALGLGGYFTVGTKQVLVPSIASVALSSAGGEGSITVDNYDQNGISFSRAASSVSGLQVSPNKYTTIADVQISNLNVLGQFQVAFMRATLTSDRELLSSDPNREAVHDRARFKVEVMYRGIFIDNKEVLPEYDAEIVSTPTYPEFVNIVKTKQATPRDRWIVENVEKKSGAIQGSVIGLARRDGVEHYRGIPVKGLGKVHLGDLAVKPDRRRLSLFRLQFAPGAFEGFGGGTEPVQPIQDVAGGSQPMEGLPENVQAFEVNALSGGGGFGTLSGGDTNTNGAPIWP